MLEWVTFYSNGFTEEEKNEIKFYGPFVEHYFLRCLENFNVKKLGKLSIDLTKDIDKPRVYGLFPKESVLAIERQFDIKRFMYISKQEKRIMLLDTILETFEFLSEKYSWDINEIERAYKMAKYLNFNYGFLLAPLKMARDRKHLAGIEINFAEEEVAVSVVFIEVKSKSIIKRIKIGSSKSPFITFYKGVLGKRKWINNREYELIDRSQKWKFIASLDSDGVQKVQLGEDLGKLLGAAYSFPRQRVLNLPQL